MITDTASLLALAMYVDLNPIRAAMADTPEASRFTGAKERLDDWRQCTSTAKGTPSGRRNGKRPAAKQGSSDRTGNSQRWERRGQGLRSGWMSPLEINEQSDPVGADASANGTPGQLQGLFAVVAGPLLAVAGLEWTPPAGHAGCDPGRFGSHPATPGFGRGQLVRPGAAVWSAVQTGGRGSPGGRRGGQLLVATEWKCRCRALAVACGLTASESK